MAQATRPWGDEIKARVRVAMEYGDQTWDQVADTFGISKKTVQRWLHEDSVSGEARRVKLAQICNVPAWFMLEGWAAIEQPREDELAELRRIVRELQQRDEGARGRRPA